MKKHKSNFGAIFVVLILTAILVALFFAAYFLMKHKILKINNFVVQQDASAVKGVDISSYQGDVDMNKLKEQGIQFVYIKATEGSSHQDEKFAKNWQAANDANLLSGAYHFFSFDSPGETQAQNYLSTVKDLSGHLIPAIDIEFHGDNIQNPPAKSAVIGELKNYISIIEKQYGAKPLLYMDNAVYEKYIKGELEDYPRWMRSVYYPLPVEYRGPWAIWQYSDTGELNSHNGQERYIDLDVLNSSISLDQLTIKP